MQGGEVISYYWFEEWLPLLGEALHLINDDEAGGQRTVRGRYYCILGEQH